MMFLFACKVPLKIAKTMTNGEISEHSLIDWFCMLREILSQAMLANRLHLGGPGEVVEIDESLWRGRRKYQVGRVPPNAPWVFGAIQRSTNKVVIFTVPSRDAAQLTAKIEDCILPGTTIYSDQWAAYNHLSNHPNGYIHRTVNHKENFLNPINPDIHTQTIEGFWGNGKHSLKAAHGVHPRQLGLFLDEVVFRWNNKDRNMFDVPLEQIAAFYPCNNAGLPQNVLATMPHIQL